MTIKCQLEAEKINIHKHGLFPKESSIYRSLLVKISKNSFFLGNCDQVKS